MKNALRSKQRWRSE